MDTITSLVTPLGRGGVAVIRVSGPSVKHIAETLLGKLPSPRYAWHTSFYNEKGDVLDEGIALYFPAPHSFTGEDVLEFQCHGGVALTDCIIKAILSSGARLAKPGEFSERAFLNNKIDLAQAEAIADLINAASEQAVLASTRSLQGVFSQKVNDIVQSVTRLRIYVEASIDFSEEEIDFLKNTQVVDELQKIITIVEELQSEAVQGNLLQEGITIVITGAPNVGKSTLLNLLSGKESAIVTDIPGTTRDVLKEYIVLDGIPLHIIDTAGLRDNTSDIVELEGIRRAKEELKKADIILVLSEASLSVDSHVMNDTLVEKYIPPNVSRLFIYNKIDLIQALPYMEKKEDKTSLFISAKHKQGIDLLKNYLKEQMGFKNSLEGSFSARRRHVHALSQAKKFLSQAYQAIATKQSGEIVAEELRLAQLTLGEITGEVSSDDLLGKIFSSFCIGK